MHRSRLRRRYGHAGGPRVVYRSGTGTTVWQLPDSKLQIMWAGPGARLRIGWDFLTSKGSMGSAIEHHTADGNYRTRKEAGAAVKRFSEAK